MPSSLVQDVIGLNTEWNILSGKEIKIREVKMADKESPTIFHSTYTRQQELGTLEITRNSINGDIEFEAHDEECNTIVWGTFRDLFELILLGKLYKAQLQAVDKKRKTA